MTEVVESLAVLLKESSALNYEKRIATYINKNSNNIRAVRPNSGSNYSDILLKAKDKTTSWLEVKMNHEDNLGNPRVFFDGYLWRSSSSSPLANFVLDNLNDSVQIKEFLIDIRNFMQKEFIKIPTTKGGLRDPDSIPLEKMREFLATRSNRYIMNIGGVDLGQLVELHYTEGKTEPAYYMQAGDDFYLITDKNPLKLPIDIPKVSGIGDLKVRISTRTKFYEVQPEVKIKRSVDDYYEVATEIKIRSMPFSPYSVKPGTVKKNPFITNT